MIDKLILKAMDIAGEVSHKHGWLIIKPKHLKRKE
jgi:hypothetical protein